jgi:uncharacterized protein YqcC (DUF446 family)
MKNIAAEALALADAIEKELKRLGRWMPDTLPDECFQDMGAFGSSTMRFEQWLQFILVPRIREIIAEQSEFPESSNVGTYAIRVFDGDAAARHLHDLLFQLDHLINHRHLPVFTQQPAVPTVTLGDEKIPEVLCQLAEVLPQFSLSDLESQLQTFDTFVAILSPSARIAVSSLLLLAAEKTSDLSCRQRLSDAAQNIADGKRASAPSDHTEAMKKYREQHNRDFNRGK